MDDFKIGDKAIVRAVHSDLPTELIDRVGIVKRLRTSNHILFDIHIEFDVPFFYHGSPYRSTSFPPRCLELFVEPDNKPLPLPG